MSDKFITLMLSKLMTDRIQNRSSIRVAFERAEALKSTFDNNNVFDFSIGNPKAICPYDIKIGFEESCSADPNVHGYMQSAGYADVRQIIAEDLNKKHNSNLSENNIIMTHGAACGINIVLQSILDPNDEVIVFNPCYPAYKMFVENFGGKLVTVPYADDDNMFRPDMSAFENAITEHTKAVIINTPNNPTGYVWSKELCTKIAATLHNYEVAHNTNIILISDEPYRDLIWDGSEMTWFPDLYDNSVVVYSFSKSCSLAGERIGYVALSPKIADFENVKLAMLQSLGDLGFVNANASAQRVVKHLINETSNFELYKTNRQLLIDALDKTGFEFTRSNGAFYVLVKSPEGNDEKFLKALEEEGIIAVGGKDFGCPCWVRFSYCLSTEDLKRAIPHLINVGEKYSLAK